jgi:hypothetical protein
LVDGIDAVLLEEAVGQAKGHRVVVRPLTGAEVEGTTPDHVGHGGKEPEV